MSDEELKRAITEISAVLGAGERQQKLAQNNLGLIKNKLGHISDRDIQKVLSKLGEDKVEEILKKLKL